MNQILTGASLPFLLGALMYLIKGARASFSMLIMIPVFMFLGSIWAVMPDIPRFFGKMDLYHRLARDPRCDIFFWHYTIDQIESDSTFYIYPFIFIFTALLAAAMRELSLREKEL